MFVLCAKYNLDMSALPECLYAPVDVRELDRRAIDDHGIPGYTLMNRAGQFAFSAIRERWPDRSLVVVCGAGNNAGDGYVIARLALNAGIPAEVIYVVEPHNLGGDAAQAVADFMDKGGQARLFEGMLPDGDIVLVDALLGTGLDREVGGRFAEVVTAINEHPAPVLAVDVPSGLNAETGQVMGVAVEARMTATFVGMKCGLLTGRGPALCGEVIYHSLGVPEAVFDGVPVKARLIGGATLRELLRPRPRDAHKGLSGHVLVVGGGEGMPGAARLAGEAALRAGAGLVSVATHPQHVAAVSADRPELMCKGVETAVDLASLIERATVIAVGPGLGQTDWAREMLDAVLATDLPLIVDADALNLLAVKPTARRQWVLTPHPGEASRLLDQDTTAIQQDRFAAAAALAERYEATVVLKGAGTLVANRQGDIALCNAGNPGMAVAGMGDVLTGVIAGLTAQFDDLWLAARCGVLVHARAGDMAAVTGGERGMLASDLFAAVREQVNPG
jgi:NAD(P)H-hydrate epimerase